MTKFFADFYAICTIKRKWHKKHCAISNLFHCIYAFHANVFKGTITEVGLYRRDLIHRFYSLDHAAKRGIVPIKVRSVIMHDKELA